MVVVLFVASIAALGAAFMVLFVAQKVAERPPARATAEADSLRREILSLRALHPGEQPGPGVIETLRSRGLADPVADLRADLAKHPELIPFPGVEGGTMGFYDPGGIQVLDERWVYARFEDGHIGGTLLLEYAVDGGRIHWKRLHASLD
jgi:hypothetical protein